MEYENVLYEPKDNIARITLNRPEKLNALSANLQRDLGSALEEADNDWNIRCIIVRGAGRAFCAGADLTPSAERNSNVERRNNIRWDIENAKRAGKRWGNIWGISKPVIAQVHGYCLAAGTSLATHCDIIIAAENAVIGFPPVRNLGTPSAFMWPYLMPIQWVKWVMFTGNNFSGKQAAEMGWALKSVPADLLEDTVDDLASTISRVSYEMLASSKSICNKAIELMGKDLLQTFAQEVDAVSHQSTAVKEFQRISQEEGLRAALEWMNAPFQDYGKGKQEA